jgi:hypothetical protein
VTPSIPIPPDVLLDAWNTNATPETDPDVVAIVYVVGVDTGVPNDREPGPGLAVMTTLNPA